MKRRDFIKKTLQTSAVAGAAFSLGNKNTVLGGDWLQQSYDLVAIKGSTPGIMFDKAIQAFGGIKNFVKANQKVVVKPNIGWDSVPERAADTNPLLVSRIVKHCLDAGAKEVVVMDHTCDNWQKCYTNSGIEKAVKNTGGKMAPANSEQYYQSITIPEGKILKTAKVHELILEADVFINVPTLKHHGSTQLSIGMKNLMGVVWDRKFYHRNGLNQCIADFVTKIKPHLTVVGAYRVLKRNGPRGVSTADVAEMKSLLLSTDIVAADTAATKLFGKDPDSVRHITYADQIGVGTKDLSSLSIKRITL